MMTKINESLTANFRQRAAVNSCIRVKRSMLGFGKLFVSVGDEVKSDDVLGKSSLVGGYSAVNISKRLGVSPKDGINFLQKPVGAKIYSGELLALKKTIFGKKVITSPTDALIDNYNSTNGDLRLKFLPKENSLTSGVYGIVESVNHDSGEVIIKTIVTQIFGIVGLGKERSGVLKIISEPGNLISDFQIKPEHAHHIIVTGALVFSEVLRRATSVGVGGIISGGINLEDLRSMVGGLYTSKRLTSDVGISVVATEGFGPITIGEDIFETLKKFEGKFIFIDGNKAKLILPTATSDSILTLRKIALPTDSFSSNISPEMKIAEIKLSSKVRIIWPPFMGAQGTVVGIDQTATLLESGISTYLLTIETARQKIRVPYTNVEMIG